MAQEIQEELTRECEYIREELEQICENDFSEEELQERKDNGYPCDMWEYFQDVLDVNFIIDINKKYRSAKIYVTLGGPNIWIDTDTATIQGRWGSTSVEVPISYNLRDEIDYVVEHYLYEF